MADDTMEDPVAILTAIRNEIRNKIPVDAILPSETLLKPEKGEVRIADPPTFDLLRWEQFFFFLIERRLLSQHYKESW